MDSHITRGFVVSLGFLISQPVLAGEVLRFSPSHGGHGIDGCAFFDMSGDANGFGWTQFGVEVDRATLELIGRVSRSHSSLAPQAVTFEIGNNQKNFLSVTLADRGEHIASERFSSEQMENVLFAVAQEKDVWMRIDSGSGRLSEPKTMKVLASTKEVSSCVEHLKGEIAEERALRAAGGVSTRF